MSFHRINILLFLLIGTCCSTVMSGQVSIGGEPPSLSSTEVDQSEVILQIFDKPAIELLLAADEDRDREGMNLRDAVAVPIGLGLENGGTWFHLSDGSKIWRLKVRVPEAFSLEAFFDQFHIPQGGEFYVYNDDASEVYGAYTERNNTSAGRISTEMIQGDIMNFEYFEPLSHAGEGQIHIQDVGYRYRDVIGLDPNTETGGAQPCEVDVSCVEGNAWSDQANSTVRVRSRINGQMFWSTGTIMNNSGQDCRPLLLTSLRCAIEGSDMSSNSDFSFYRFYFGYQASDCGALSTSQVKSMSGCVRLADSNDQGGTSGSDFILLELNSLIPQEYEPYYAGWDANAALTTGGGVSIHHPSGDVKKISTYLQVPSSADWGVSDTHWMVQWVETTNGHGVREVGSSGCGLFNASGRLIGTLTGGTSFCNEIEPNGQTRPDLFGKLSFHWDGNPNPLNEKLKLFLDPSNLGLLVLDGSSNPCLTGIEDVSKQLFSLGPVPADQILNIYYGGFNPSGGMTVSDITGKIIRVDLFYGAQNVTLDTSTLRSGIYFLSITSDSGIVSTQRFVVNH